MRRLVAIAAFAVLVVATGCAGLFNRRQACFAGSAPSVGRPGTDETYAFLHREWRRSRSKAPAVVKSRILEAIPDHIPDASDLVQEPTCAPEIVEASVDALDDQRVIVPSRWLVARIRAAGDTGDTTDVMDRKARFLLRVATLTDDQIGEYRLGPDEPGPRPPKRYVRYVALAAIGNSNLFLNVEDIRRFVAERLATTPDDRERLLLTGYAAALFERALPSGMPTNQATLLQRWLADARAKLAGGPDAIGLEVVLADLALLGKQAKAYGLEPDVRALLDEIVAARGRFPLARDVPGGDRDLARTAITARYDLDVPGTGGWVPPATPSRRPYQAWRGLTDGEPAGGVVAPAATARRLADLDAELARATRAEARCHVLAVLPPWVPRAEADRRFDALVAPVREGTSLRTSRENLCRLSAALAIDGVSIDRRADLIATALDPKRVLPFDGKPDSTLGLTMPSMPYVALIAARALASHVEWLDASPELRRTIAALALLPLGARSQGELHDALHPAYAHVLAEPIAAAWLADVRAVASREPSDAYEIDAAVARIAALSDAAPRLGLATRVRAALAEIAALPQPGPGALHTHALIVRAATVGAALLAIAE